MARHTDHSQEGRATAGLSISHGTWDGPHALFAGWRSRIAQVADYHDEIYEFERVRLDCGTLDASAARAVPWFAFTAQHDFGEWDETPNDPLIVLLTHSESSGVIHPEQAFPLAERLAGLIPLLHPEDDAVVIALTTRFVAGLRTASGASERVVFRVQLSHQEGRA